MEVTRNIFLAILFLSISIYSQSLKENIQKRNQELNKLRKEVEALESKLIETSTKEKESYYSLQNLNKKSFLLNNYIKALESEIKYSSKIIDSLSYLKKNYISEYEKLKNLYASSIIFLYKYNNKDMIRYLINSNNMIEALYRYKYFKDFAKKAKERSYQIQNCLVVIDSVSSQIAEQQERKKILVSNFEKERLELAKAKREHELLLASLKKNKQVLLDEIKIKKQAQEELKNIIVQLNEKSLKETSNSKTAKTSSEKENKNKKTNKSNFAATNGKLPWPLKGGKIVRDYGVQKNQNLNTLTMNYGIDIKAAASKEVIAVAEGVVSSIKWLPSYGAVIIITHPNNFRTVYAKLGEIYVKENDKVSQGSVIATVGQSIDGNILHFQIWNERSVEDPMDYLAFQ
jgi:septal ring factor EnvC (AmiA/AmiB activator)